MLKFAMPRLSPGQEASFTLRHEGPGPLQLVTARVPNYPLHWQGVELRISLSGVRFVIGAVDGWFPATVLLPERETEAPPLRFNLLLSPGDWIVVSARNVASQDADREPLVELLESTEAGRLAPICIDPSAMATLVAKYGKDWFG